MKQTGHSNQRHVACKRGNGILDLLWSITGVRKSKPIYEKPQLKRKMLVTDHHWWWVEFQSKLRPKGRHYLRMLNVYMNKLQRSKNESAGKRDEIDHTMIFAGRLDCSVQLHFPLITMVIFCLHYPHTRNLSFPVNFHQIWTAGGRKPHSVVAFHNVSEKEGQVNHTLTII